MLAMCNVAVEKSNVKGEIESNRLAKYESAVFTSYFGKKKKITNVFWHLNLKPLDFSSCRDAESI